MLIRDIPTRHPVLWFCGCLAIIGFPQWFQAVWGLFRTDAPIPVLRAWLERQDIMSLPTFSPYLVTVPIGVVMFLWLIWELRDNRNANAKSQGDTLDATATVGPATPASSDSPTYLNATEAIQYIANESEWGAAKSAERTPEGLGKNVMLEAPAEFQKRASEGKIRVYGIGVDGPSHEPIDKTHWMTYGLELTRLFKRPYDDCITWPTIPAWPKRLKCYSYLKIEAEDVYRVWPRRASIKDEDFMPMPTAARSLYEEARKRNRYLAIAAERMSGNKNGQIGDGTPEDILDYVATYIGGKAQIYGTRPPSERKELIARTEVARSTFESGALVLKNDRHIYTTLEIPKRDLQGLIDHLKVNEL